MNFALPDHFRKRQTQFCRAHRAGQRDQHLAAFNVSAGGFTSVGQRSRVEMPEVVVEKAPHGACCGHGLNTLEAVTES